MLYRLILTQRVTCMAILEVLTFPDERLRTVAKPVAKVDKSIKDLIQSMFETMKEEKGIGLAATQVNVHKRVVVMDISEDQNEPYVFINPEIIEKTGSIVSEEGCLSVPDNYAKVDRAEHVTVQALDEHGETFELDAHGLLAICIQHELDHLKGKLFVDYLSPLKRGRIKKKLEKEARLAAKE
jgi:peptide deformylase